MNYVVDASVAVKWYLPEIFEQQAALLLGRGHDLYAPELVLPEFGNIIWKKVKRNELEQDEADVIISDFSLLRLHVYSHKGIIQSAYAGAQATGQTVYDWTYLALAISLSCMFITADERFYKVIEKTVYRSQIQWIGDL